MAAYPEVYGLGQGTLQVATKPLIFESDPVSSQDNFVRGQLVFSKSSNNWFIYSGAGVWDLFTSASGDVVSISGNSGTATPSAGNINVVGTGSLTATASGSTDTISLTGLTNHALLVGAGTATITKLALGTAGQLLTSGGASADPTWTTATFPATAGAAGTVLRSNGTNWVASTDTFPDTVVAGDILIATAANVVGSLPDVATGQVLMSGGVGVAPAYSGSPSVSGTITAGTGLVATAGNLSLNGATAKVNINAGTAATASIGTSAALDGASPSQLVVSTTAVTAASKIFLSVATTGGTPGFLSIGTIVPGVSFQILSSANGDTSTVNYWIVN